jgi:hypothetical protein
MNTNNTINHNTNKMEKLDRNVVLGKGTLGVEFGMTREKVKAILGEPDEIETFSEEEDGQSEAWHYDEHELSATFDEMDDWRLTSLAVSSDDFLFEGVNLIGLSSEEVIQQLEIMDLGEVSLEEISDENIADQQVATIIDVSLNLWFEDGLLTEIQWGPFWDEDEEEYIWPE